MSFTCSSAAAKCTLFEVERLLVQLGRLPFAGVLPRRDVREVRVVALRLAVRRLALLPEVRAARLRPVERVDAHQLRQLEEVRHPARLLERLVQLGAAARER